MNQITLLGYLGRDPELRHLQSGTPVCNFSMATTETFMSNGQKTQSTEWHQIITYGPLAEVCSKYLTKGRQALVVGRVQSRQYQPKEGGERTVWEVIARNVEFVGGGDGKRNESRNSDGDRGTAAAAGATHQRQSGDDEDIPF